MADKSSRLANILKQEYQSKGIVGGLASATGKRVLEKLDIRNALFGGSGVGSLIGKKIFGKGYSAINEKPSVDKLSTQSAILSADKLDTIGMNTQITAKNSMAIPSMARDMNVMRQNIIKLVKLQGGTPTNKADAFFSKSKDRESMYESLFGKKEKPTPTQVKTQEKGTGFLGTLLSGFSALGTLIVGTIRNALSGIPAILSEVFSIKNLMSAFGVAANTLSAIFKIVGLVATNPVFLAIAGIASAAAMLSFMRGNYDAEKTRYMELAEKKKNAGSLSAEEEKELRALDRPNFKSEATTKLNYDPIAGVESTAKTPGQIAAQNRRNSIRQGAPDAAGAGRGGQGGATAEQATSPSRVGAKANAESYLGAPISEQDWDMLLRAVYAESSQNQEEYAHVMAVILNRARKNGGSISAALLAPNQFQAVTGANGEGPSAQFKKGPDARSAEMILKSTDSLKGISTSLDSFTAANVAAYGAVGGQAKFNQKMAEMQAANGKTIGGTVFAENLYRQPSTGNTLNQSSTMMAALAREAQSGGNNVTNNNIVNNNGGQQGAPVQVAMADVVDYELGRMLTRMYE